MTNRNSLQQSFYILYQGGYFIILTTSFSWSMYDESWLIAIEYLQIVLGGIFHSFDSFLRVINVWRIVTHCNRIFTYWSGGIFRSFDNFLLVINVWRIVTHCNRVFTYWSGGGGIFHSIDNFLLVINVWRIVTHCNKVFTCCIRRILIVLTTSFSWSMYDES